MNGLKLAHHQQPHFNDCHRDHPFGKTVIWENQNVETAKFSSQSLSNPQKIGNRAKYGYTGLMLYRYKGRIQTFVGHASEKPTSQN